METYRRFEDQEVVFLGLSPEEEAELPDMRSFVEATGIPWPNAYGAGDMLSALGVVGLPTVFVVDRQGTIVWSGHPQDDLAAAIQAALDKPAADNA